MTVQTSLGIVEYIYDHNVTFQTGPSDINQEEGEVFSLPPQKAKRKNIQQKAYVYDEVPKEIRQEKILAKVSSGVDGRQRILNTTAWPNTIHVQLTMIFNGEIYGGSGVMVGPHQLLTCAHNVFDTIKKKWAEKIMAFPALNDNYAPFGKVDVVKVYLYANWTNHGDKKFDIALLILNQAIGKYTGWGGILCIPDQQIEQEKINITGYPGDKGLKQMWSMSHNIKSIAKEEFEYDIDTSGGQSGGAIWINKWGLPLILGVHTLGGDEKNFGVRISEQKFTDLLLKVINATCKFNKPEKDSDSLTLSATMMLSSLKKRETPFNREGRGRVLIEAAALGNLNEVKQLLGLDTDVNAINRENETALMCACENGHLTIVTILTENGALVDLERKNGDRALEIATKKNFTAIVHYLVSEGAKLIKELEVQENIPWGSQVNIRRHCPSIASAASLGNLVLVRLFLDQGVQVNEVESSHNYTIYSTTGGNALLAACRNGHESVVKLLLSRGIDLMSGQRRESGEVNFLCHKALQAACDNRHWKLTRYLLEEGFDIDSVASKDSTFGNYTTHGENFLFTVCAAGEIEIICLLLGKNVDLKRVMETHSDGYYDYQTVSGTGQPMTCRQKRYRTVTVGSRALSYAKGNEEVIQLLRLKGATEDS